jgi:hypothetical protein
MPNHSTPGIDGVSSEFFNIFAGTDGIDTQTDTDGNTTKTPIANPLVALVSQAFREMLLRPRWYKYLEHAYWNDISLL